MTNTTQPMTSREAFEAWLLSNPYVDKKLALRKNIDGTYSYFQGQYEGWQASQAQQEALIVELKRQIAAKDSLIDSYREIEADCTKQAQTIAELVEALDIAKDILEAHTLTHVYDALIAKVKGK